MPEALRSLSVIWKLLLIVGLTVSAVVGTLIWESSRNLTSGLTELARLNRSDIGQLLAENVSGGIRWNKPQAIEKAYTELVTKADSTISDLITWDADGNVLTRDRLPHLPAYPLAEAERQVGEQPVYRDADSHSLLALPVRSGKDDERVGTVAVAFANERLDRVV